MDWSLRDMRNKAIWQCRNRAEREGVWPARGFAGAREQPKMFLQVNRSNRVTAHKHPELAEQIDWLVARNLAGLVAVVNALHTCVKLGIRALIGAATSHAAIILARAARGDAHANIELRERYAVRVKLRGLHHVALLSARNAREVLAVG